MAGIGNLVDLLLFYTLERVLFNRMLISMGNNSKQVKEAMAIWLMLEEEIGYQDLIRTINSYDNNTIDEFFKEALLCVECIKPNAVTASSEVVIHDTPVFSGLFEEPMNLRFFHYNRVSLYKRYGHVMETVCDKIFGEEAAIEVDESGMRPVVVRPQEGQSMIAAAVSGVAGCSSEVLGRDRELPKQSRLNPDATEFHPGQAPEDARTMFLTFSKGYPLSRGEIFHFFTSSWGKVVQDVLIEQTHGGQEPQYGRITFTSSSVIPMVLNGQTKAKFFVNHKHLWARTYLPRRRGRRN